MSNPYAAPASSAPGATYTASVFGLHGRIGRGRYLMYSVFPTCATLLLMAPLFVLAGWFLGTAMLGLALLALLSHLLIVAARRLDDLDRARGWILLLGVPGVNVLFVLYLLCAPGNPDANPRGPAPTSSVSAFAQAAWLACALLPVIVVLLYGLAKFKLPV
ncbi:DUF805 domain-containing protein [Massilia genomosp. 1]|uniref:DUF805 domain-containing protein n=1 Tax=Massilia genomosp. 1 TaxID=2609280 RepID=UPI00141E663C|nr:DUF805 domain-containing protein [Massilia genomosp. 1]